MTEPNPEVEVRAAQEKDVSPIMEMIRGIAAYEKLTHQLEITEDSLRESLFGDNPTPRALVATFDGQTVGYAIFFFNFSTFLGKRGIYLEDLYVESEYRGKGVGNLLFKSVAQVAYDEGCGRMEWVALDWNTPALEFYQAKGAAMLDDWRLHRLTRDGLEALTQSDA